MHLRLALPVVLLLSSSGLAMASSLPAGKKEVSLTATAAVFSGTGKGLSSAKEVLYASGIMGAIAAVSNSFRDHSSGERVNLAHPAPEIGTSGLFSGMILLVGAGLVVRGRQ